MNANKIVAALVICLSAAGCYQQRPLQTPTPAPATRVVAQLTDSGTVVMGSALGPGVLAVEGVVAKADEHAWTLQMVRVDQRDGRSISWNRELVSFPRNLLANPNVVVLDKKRSWLAAAGITVGAIVLARVFNVIGSDENQDGDPNPQESVVGGGR